MSMRNKKQISLEIEIEKARFEKDWASLANLLKKYAKLNNISESPLECLVQAERFISEDDYSNALIALNKAYSLDPNNQEVIAYLAVVEYKRNDLALAMKHLSKLNNPFTNINSNDVLLNNRKVGLLIQAFNIKGKCYENQGDPQSALTSYQNVTDIAFRYFKNLRLIDSNTKPFIEDSLLRVAMIQKYFGNTQIAIKQIRSSLSLQMGLTSNSFVKSLWTLSQLLLRNVPSASFIPMMDISDPNNAAVQSKQQFYIPHDEVEEAILALQNAEVVLPNTNMDIGHQSLLYEDLCLAYSRKQQFYNIVEIYEKSLVVKFNDHHKWIQLALALYSCGKYKRSLFIIEECLSYEPKSTTLLLLASKICINHLSQMTKGIAFAKEAIQCIDQEDSTLLSTAYLSIGVAYCKKAIECKSYNEKQTNQELSLFNLKKAYILDPYDYRASYQLALIYSDIRDTPLGLKYIHESLGLNSDEPSSWNLLSILLSSNKNYELAYRACKHALSQSPTNVELLLTKAKIEMALDDGSQSLITYKTVFTFLSNDTLTSCRDNDDTESLPRNSRNQSGPSSVVSFDIRSATTADKSHKSSTLQSLSETDTFEDSPQSTKDLLRATSGSTSYASNTEIARRVHLWLSLCEAFTQQRMFKDAALCLAQAESLDNNNADIFYHQGYLLEIQDYRDKAISHYHRALTIDASHTATSIRLAGYYLRENDLLLAENNLTTILRSADPTSHQAWFQLGLVLKSKGEIERSSDCFKRAIELDKTAPLIPYNTIPRYIN
ncbi:hypothetical protein CYY_007061 [Polysphondylium violaceum]|uniref:Tetratricopeptide-like helical domain-containing protein n=1 Tax=Polysphondylium violaceum TaxID=133409 RepID=A0A8J4PPQ7_9MYCE|nr:hypothetical protein CYY_007061 [Polysphondylium violaceum]